MTMLFTVIYFKSYSNVKASIPGLLFHIYAYDLHCAQRIRLASLGLVCVPGLRECMNLPLYFV